MTLVDLGFTGTRQRPTEWQIAMLRCHLAYHRGLGFTQFHHGDCVGADAIAAAIARELGYTIIGHPPDNDSLRAHYPSDRDEAPLPYQHRNEVIVLVAQAALAVPNTVDPQTRSGTWSTIRKLKLAKRPTWVIAPDRMWSVVPAVESAEATA
jgi:hypothetical protein